MNIECYGTDQQLLKRCDFDRPPKTFIYCGKAISPEDTPASLGMKDNDEIKAIEI